MPEVPSTCPERRRMLASAAASSRQHRSPSCSMVPVDGGARAPGAPFAGSRVSRDRPALRIARRAASVGTSFYLAVAVLGGLLLFIVAVQSAWSVAMILQPRELLGSESVVYDKAARVYRGEPLYQPLDRAPYSVAAYTPLYYALAGLGMAIFGPGFGPGRAISFIAGLAAALLVRYLAARRARD